MNKLVSQAEIDAFFAGRHGDPFAVLGMHETEQGIEIRAILPDASRVVVLNKETHQAICELNCVDERGFFTAVVPDTRSFFAYRLQVFWGNESQIVEDPYRFHPMMSDLDNWFFAEGSYLRPYEILGAHFMECDGVTGVNFRLWAPNAKRVSVVGDFNYWDGRRNPMRRHQSTGIWELFLPKASLGQLYKFELLDCNDQLRLKADPYAFSSQLRPDTASQIGALPDIVAMTEQRRKANQADQPISIYEVHLGSWRRNLANNYWLDYDQIAEELIPYVKEMGFTHIEFLPLSEFPFDGSWGYQPIGLYAPTSRFGSPEAFKRLIDKAHQAGINVILDWVPGHFPSDTHGLAAFDGTALYEHADPREGYHQDWNTLIYNYGRHEVKNFLASNALYWLERFGLDGIRVDAVASMIYRDYSRADGQWIPNQYGGRENLEAIAFLKHINEIIQKEIAGVISIAEESTSFAGVSHPLNEGGLGFNFKWNMGWMNDTLSYMQKDPIYRQYHHNQMTFGMMYQYSENFVLPLSHDEVVHGKYSLLGKMPGDAWQQFANLRAYYGYMWGYPGKKLLFMGNEFAQGREWNYQESLDWYLLEDEFGGGWHKGVQDFVRDLNRTYQQQAALYELDNDPAGFEWLVADDATNSVFVFERRSRQGEPIIVVSNFTPVPRHAYRFGVNIAGEYEEIINSDAGVYKGSNVANVGKLVTEEIESHGKTYSLSLVIPPLATVYLKLKKAKKNVAKKRTTVKKTTRKDATAEADSVVETVEKTPVKKTSVKRTTAKTATKKQAEHQLVADVNVEKTATKTRVTRSKTRKVEAMAIEDKSTTSVATTTGVQAKGRVRKSAVKKTQE